MVTEIEHDMFKLAMIKPEDSLPVLGITTESSVTAVGEKFLSAYIAVNGGDENNQFTRARVNQAVKEWFTERSIPEWLARACVLAELQQS